MKTFSLVALIIPILVSCMKELPPPEIKMPSTPILTGTVSWGIVNQSYLRISLEAGNKEHVAGILRCGDLVHIESLRICNASQGNTKWYGIRRENISGWVPVNTLDSYCSREKAETASREILKIMEQ